MCLFDSLDSLCTRCVTLCMMCVCTVIDTLYSCIMYHTTVYNIDQSVMNNLGNTVPNSWIAVAPVDEVPAIPVGKYTVVENDDGSLELLARVKWDFPKVKFSGEVIKSGNDFASIGRAFRVDIKNKRALLFFLLTIIKLLIYHFIFVYREF